MMLGIIKKVISNTLIDYKNMQTVQMLFEPLAKKHRRIMELVKLNASVYKGRVRESFFMIIQTKGYIGINISSRNCIRLSCGSIYQRFNHRLLIRRG